MVSDLLDIITHLVIVFSMRAHQGVLVIPVTSLVVVGLNWLLSSASIVIEASALCKPHVKSNTGHVDL